jgi:exopolysaccharide biosynthesis protein
MFLNKKAAAFVLLLVCALGYQLLPVKAEITDVNQTILAPGLIHHRFVKHVARGPVIINILEIDMQSGYTVKPALAQPNTIWAKATLPQIVSREGAFAGINANYFNNRGMPIGSLAIDREWITGPVFRRASVSIDKNGKVSFARPYVSGNLQVYRNTSGNSIAAYFPPPKAAIQNFKVESINQPDSLSPNGISFYNHWWQDKVACGNGRACVVVDGNGIVRMKVSIYESTVQVSPTRTDYVLSARTDDQLSRIFIGDKLSLSWTSQPDWSSVTHVIGGGPYLVSKGEIILNDLAEGFSASSGIRSVAPRTAIGITAPGRLIWLTADGRQKNSVGLGLWELAALLKEIGVVEAVNFDGGGSTTLVVDGKMANSPSDSSGPRSVSTALLLYKPGQQNSKLSSVGNWGGP